MDIQAAFAACEMTVRRADPDRYFSALFAPPDKRPLLLALYAFNHELARIAELVREPMMGEIRLQWWREMVAGARAGQPRPHDVAMALAGAFRRVALPARLFDAMIDARAFDISPEAFADDTARDAYLDATSGNLMRLAARILGAGAAVDDVAREAGTAYGLAGLLRSESFHAARRKSYFSDRSTAQADSHARFNRAREMPNQGAALPAFLPASLVPLYLKYGNREVPLYRKQLAMLTASVRGHI
jgi:phytoene/squalene synthetase